MAKPNGSSPMTVPPSPAPRLSSERTGFGFLIVLLLGAAIGAYQGNDSSLTVVVPDPAEQIQQLPFWMIVFAILGAIHGLRQRRHGQHPVGSALQAAVFFPGVFKLLPAAVAWTDTEWGDGQYPVAVGALVGVCLMLAIGAVCLVIERLIERPQKT
jgi:hypothetical protein